MNCNNCGKPMGASVHQDESNDIQAIHICAHCGAKHVLSFERPQAPAKPKSKVGHQVEWAFGFGRHIFTYSVIAQYRNWKGSTVYVLSEWDSNSRRFKELEVSAYAGLSQAFTFSPSPVPMSNEAIALQKAYKAMNTLKAVNKSLRRVDGQVQSLRGIEVVIDTRGGSSNVYFEDRAVLPERVWGDKQAKLKLIAQRTRLIDKINSLLDSITRQASV